LTKRDLVRCIYEVNADERNAILHRFMYAGRTLQKTEELFHNRPLRAVDRSIGGIVSVEEFRE
jgi:hypothetical protein